VYFYGEQNKYRWEGGGQKHLKKGINIFSNKGFLRGGGTMLPKGGTPKKICALAHIMPHLNKRPRTPLMLNCSETC